MADNAKIVTIRFGERETRGLDTSGPIWDWEVKQTLSKTGSLWDYRYADASSLEQYSGSIDPIFGPECRIHGGDLNYACYAAPTGHAGPEGSRKYDYVTIKPGQDTYIYLDVGFWGGSRKRKYDQGTFVARWFGLVCGPHVWLCIYGQAGDAPEPKDPFAYLLSSFQKQMGNFGVVQHATLPSEMAGDSSGGSMSMTIYLILPDMHMWPYPEALKNKRKEFFSQEELNALDSGLKDGKLVRQSDGSLDIPVQKGESADDHAARLLGAPEGRAAMKENALSDTRKMSEQEEKNAFGSAGTDLIKLLDALQRARDKDFRVTLLHVGDLLEMWSPFHTWVSPNPFKYEIESLKLTDTANQRIPKWLDLVYSHHNNQAALRALDNAACYQIYGNHDVYLAFDEWKLSNIGTMDRLRNSPGYFSDDILWVEHGHRFDPSNRDGYWMFINLGSGLNKPAVPGPIVNTAVNYYPELRDFGDKYDNPDENLYTKNVPYATIWYLLAHYASVDKSIGFRLPPKFRIFCQGHTHSPVLLKVKVFWGKLLGKYSGTAAEESVMKEEQRREQGKRDGSYVPKTTEDAVIELEQARERRTGKK